MTSNYNIPESDLRSLSDTLVFDENGDRIPFGNIYKDKRTVVIFIRHFFCGSCKAYIEAIAKIRKDAFENANTDIALIGCGDYTLLKEYIESTGFNGRGYADPSRKTYKLLGMISTLKTTPKGEQKKEYVPNSFLMNTLRSTWAFLKTPSVSLAGKGGNVFQLGGELILGPGDTCSFIYRMQHTEDHTDVADLMRVSNVEYP